jgi:protein TonB
MLRDKFIIFLTVSLLFHIILVFFIKQNLFYQNTRLFKKNKEKNITKVRFIDLPDKLKEKKNNKAKYIAQKSFAAKKNVKKENPLVKTKKLKPQKKVAVVKETVPLIPSAVTQKKVKKLIKKHQNKKSGKNSKVKTKPIKKFKKVVSRRKKERKPVLRKPSKPKKEIISLNKVTPSYKELLEKGFALNKPPEKKKQKGKTMPEVYKDVDVQKLSPNIFKSSHIYPDDIDISDSISISTQSSRFASYLHKVKRKIELVWEYPRIAGEMGIQGRLFIKMQIDKSGKLVGVKLLKSSGATILDREAIRAIREAAPYPPFPKDNSFGVNTIKIHACFEYVIGGKEVW